VVTGADLRVRRPSSARSTGQQQLDNPAFEVRRAVDFIHRFLLLEPWRYGRCFETEQTNNKKHGDLFHGNIDEDSSNSLKLVIASSSVSASAGE